jgi:hypothetical protein
MRPRFFAARRNGHPILCFIIGGGTGLNQLAVRISQAARLAVGARSDRRFPRLQLTGAIRLGHVPMRSTCATEPYGADTTGEEPAARRRGKNSSTSAGTNSYAPRSRSSKAAPSTGAAKANRMWRTCSGQLDPDALNAHARVTQRAHGPSRCRQR